MKRTLSPIALLFTSVSAILGSGWLFSAYYTSNIAGPGAILSWLIGGGAVIIIAFVFAELSAMLPITGSSTRIPQFTHGTIVSFTFSWMIWLSYAALVPTEVQAILQYLTFYFPTLTQWTGALTSSGYVIATILMLLVSTINIFSLRWLIRCNNILTVIKIIIPIFVSIIILALYFSPHKVIHPAHTSFMPFGFHGVLAAIAAGGIIFAFNGFKQACEMAGEAKHPHRNLPIAIIGSVGACLIIYLLLQTAFISSLTPQNLSRGWSNLHLVGDTSPFAAIVQQDHLGWLLPLLFVGALIGPLAASLMYVGSSSRALYGTSKNGYIPAIFQKLSGNGNPIIAILTNFALGMFLFAPLPGWNTMVAFFTSLIAVAYAIGPISLLALRKQVPLQKRPFKLPMPRVWATTAFYICTLITYWSGWKVISKLDVALVVGFLLLFVYHFGTKRGREITFNWQASTWMWLYFIGLSSISYLGTFGGGRGLISFGWDFALIAIFSVFIMIIAIRFRMPAKFTRSYIKELKLET